MSTDGLPGADTGRVIARIGLAQDVPTLLLGEFGWDLDKKVARMGDGTSSPPRMPTDKSYGDFDFSLAGRFTFNQINLATGGKVDGVTLSKLNKTNGMLVRLDDDTYSTLSIRPNDSTLQITNMDGVAGNVDIRISDAVMDLIDHGEYLTEIITSARFTGVGTATFPLQIKDASLTQVGAVRLATSVETAAGLLANVAVTPYSFTTMPAGSAVVNHLKSLFQTTLTIYTNSTLSGAGTPTSLLSVVQADDTQRGAFQFATQAEVNAGTVDNKAISPATLKGLAPNSPTIIQLAISLGISFPLSISNLVMSGIGILGNGNPNPTNGQQQVLVIPYTTKADIIAGAPAGDQNIVNQATLKGFFPSGVLKTEPLQFGNFPLPAVAGKGAFGYDATVDGLKASDGVGWRGWEAYRPYQELWKLILAVTYTGTSTQTITMLPYDRLYIHVLVPSNGLIVNVVQANINGSWQALTDEPANDDDDKMHIAMMDGVNMSILYGSPGNLQTRNYYSFPNSAIVTQQVGPWNGQLRGVASNSSYRCFVFRPFAADQTG